MMQRRLVAGSTAGLILSVVFAALLLGAHRAEFWLDSWLPGEGQPALITLRLPSFSVYRLNLGRPVELVRRQVIIGRGEIIEPNEDAHLGMAYEQSRRQNQIGWSLGVFFVCFFAALLFLNGLRRTRGASKLLRAQITLLALILAFAVGAKAFLLLTSLPSFYYPMPAVVLLAAFIFGRRVALATNLLSSFVFSSLLGFDISAMVVLFTTSYAGTLFLRNRKKRWAVIQAGSLAGWFGALALLVLMLVFTGSINIHRELLNPDYSAVLAAVVNGVFSGVVALVLIEPIGWLVGRVSPSKLVELQDLDNPILKQIREKAPGTWEHSRAAANLAEAAAAVIGADSLLVRVGAYVHDAGKALNPAYFIENQSVLAVTNPHDELEPEVSADCIFDHVREGVDLLRKHHVPEAVVEFAYTHHGTSLLEYFWVKNMQAGNPKGLKEKAFCYPGTRPQTKETGILMIVDAVEAASRTIKEPAKHKYEGLVQRIVFTKLGQGELDECGLTLGDLRAVITTLVDSLVSMYHARIEYPWQRSTATTQTGPQASVSETGPRPSYPHAELAGQPGVGHTSGEHVVDRILGSEVPPHAEQAGHRTLDLEPPARSSAEVVQLSPPRADPPWTADRPPPSQQKRRSVITLSGIPAPKVERRPATTAEDSPQESLDGALRGSDGPGDGETSQTLDLRQISSEGALDVTSTDTFSKSPGYKTPLPSVGTAGPLPKDGL